MTNVTKAGNTKEKGRFGWVKRVLGGLFILLIVLMICGSLYQTIAMKQDQKRYPPPGELVDVGGHRLHLHCVGTGSPTVILEAGLGENWLSWHLVQDSIAGVTRVCAYDRAGLGWSDAAPGPLPSAQVAESLHTLLNNADIQGPYVLVGHSYGGFHVRSFAYQYPEEVAGIVLVDAYHENQLFRLPAEFAQVNRDGTAELVSTLKLVHTLAPFGVVRAFGLAASFAQGDAVGNSLAPEDYDVLVALYNRTHFSQAVIYENELAILDVEQTRPLSSLGDIPLLVLAKASDDADPDATGITEEMLVQANEITMDLQGELAALSTNGELIVVENTGHYIQIDQPDAVIEAVNTLVASLH